MRLFASWAAIVAASALCSFAPGSTAQAQMATQIDPQTFVMPVAGGTTFTIDRPTVPRHLSFVFGVGAQYAGAPFVRSNADGSTTPIVRNLGQADLMAAIGLFEVLELGMAVPIVLGDVVDGPGDPVMGAISANPSYGVHGGPGDLRFSAKIPILRGDFGLALRGVFTVPTGDNGHFLGERSWTALPELIAAYKLGPITLAANAGYLLRRRAALYDFEQDDEIHAGAGLVWTIVPWLAAIAEAEFRIGAGGRYLRSNENPAELDVGVRIMPSHSIAIEVGGGTGFLAGVGSPLPRLFAAFRYMTEQEPCAAGPEDFDGYQDGDFCADPDNDGDGILDGRDECPNDAEDHDGFADEDGCPDPDNDADGVPDRSDRCPLESEDRDGYQDQDGCPEPDNDQDGIPDGLDQCPNDPEDRDNYQDTDGCPEPGPNAATVTVTDTRILISEHIYFDFDQDTIRSVSLPLLDQVADVVLHLPGSRHIRVEGYSDNQGNERYNLDLSYRRARAVVNYLVSKGVPQNRLSYEGYGSQHAVGPNDTPEGQALNRRVEFTILDEATHGGGAATPTPTPSPDGTTPDAGGHHHHHHHGDTPPQ